MHYSYMENLQAGDLLVGLPKRAQMCCVNHGYLNEIDFDTGRDWNGMGYAWDIILEQRR